MRAAAVGRAEVIGTRAAAAEAGVPRRTVDYWRASAASARGRHASELQAMVASTRESLREDMLAAAGESIVFLRAKVADPAASDRDRVRAADAILKAAPPIAGIPSLTQSMNISVDGTAAAIAATIAGLTPEDRDDLAAALKEMEP